MCDIPKSFLFCSLRKMPPNKIHLDTLRKKTMKMQVDMRKEICLNSSNLMPSLKHKEIYTLCNELHQYFGTLHIEESKLKSLSSKKMERGSNFSCIFSLKRILFPPKENPHYIERNQRLLKTLNVATEKDPVLQYSIKLEKLSVDLLELRCKMRGP